MKSEECSCSLSFVDSGAYHIIRSHGLKREESVDVDTHKLLKVRI